MKGPKSTVKNNLCGYDMELLSGYGGMASVELSIWERFYLPAPVEGLTVMDIGAGCGETAAFYLSHGAKKIIAVEPDREAFALLEKNAKSNGMNVEPINDVFRLTQLELEFDLLKMDIEGGEALLLDWAGELTKPLVIEAHDEEVAKRLMKRFGLKRVFRMTEFRVPQSQLLHLKESKTPKYRETVIDRLVIAKARIGQILR